MFIAADLVSLRIRVFVCVNSSRPSQHFAFMSGLVFLELNRYYRINYLAQRHSIMALGRLDPSTPRAHVKHSATEPLRSSEAL